MSRRPLTVFLLARSTIRLPVLALLVTLSPLVQFLLSAFALLGVLTALFFRLLGTPNFPFWGMIGFSIGCRLLLMAYHGLVHLLSRDR
jgi:hypothetical protein